MDMDEWQKLFTSSTSTVSLPSGSNFLRMCWRGIMTVLKSRHLCRARRFTTPQAISSPHPKPLRPRLISEWETSRGHDYVRQENSHPRIMQTTRQQKLKVASPFSWNIHPQSMAWREESLSFIQHEEGMEHALWESPDPNPGPWVPSRALWPLRYTPGNGPENITMSYLDAQYTTLPEDHGR